MNVSVTLLQCITVWHLLYLILGINVKRCFYKYIFHNNVISLNYINASNRTDFNVCLHWKKVVNKELEDLGIV